MDLPGFLNLLDATWRLLQQNASVRWSWIAAGMVAGILLTGCTAVDQLAINDENTGSEAQGDSVVDFPFVASADLEDQPGATSDPMADLPAPLASLTPEPRPTATLDPTMTFTPEPTATISPTETAVPTQVPSATPTGFPTTMPTQTPPTHPLAEVGDSQSMPVPDAVNGVPVEEIAVLSAAARQQVRDTFTLGQRLGRAPNAFSKIGDSVTFTPHYLTRFDSGDYTLGEYAYLQPAIDHFAGSFARYGVAIRIGLHAWSLFDPMWADKEFCLPNEDMVACEIRLHNPAVLLIRLGSNDSGPAEVFDENMRMLVSYALENGIIPILGTKADRFEGPDDRNNIMIRQIAADYQIPLWDFDRASESLPNRGLGGDQVHMTMVDRDDYTDPKSFERGYPVSDLTALMTLHAVYEEIAAAGDS